jgi:hypothetical protein
MNRAGASIETSSTLDIPCIGGNNGPVG